MRKIRLEKCSIRGIDNQEAIDFLEENHRQGAAKKVGALSSFGLFFQDELLAVIQFCYPRTEEKKRHYTSELLRLAFKQDVRVFRGASALIKHYIETKNPADFFTYQDTSGETTAVYEHAGMRLVSQAKKKQYLVAPGKTLETGSRREVLGMAYATRYGPDRILGTKLGEVYRENGSRKSNQEIFLEELGWHIEETTGDRVYEWVNPQMTHYTYRITASDSDKYYYGVRSILIANATEENCLADPYMGSGGKLQPNNKFVNFKKAHQDLLEKSVIGIYSRKAEAYDAEFKLIGDKWATDPLCLNSAPGGKRHAPVMDYGSHHQQKECEIHGMTAHTGRGSCVKCSVSKVLSTQFCEVHGKTKHRAGKCIRCSRLSQDSVQPCPVHGMVLHQKNACYKCASSKTHSMKLCAVHGMTSHAGDKCTRCYTSKVFSEKDCPIHGLVTFRANQCMNCQADARISERECPVHGLTKFQGDTCARCSVLRGVSSGVCEKHGEGSFTGGTCNRCRAESGVKKVQCPIHGEATSVGDKCRLCVNQKAVNMRECSIHGLTKHQGEKCSSCSSMATAHRLYHGKKPNKKCHLCIESLKVLELANAG